MKAKIYVTFILIWLFVLPAFSLINLCDTNRHINIKMRYEYGAVIINSKKVRVPYTIQETSVPTHARDLTEFLFLKNGKVCFVTTLILLVMSTLIAAVYYMNTTGRLYQYRRQAITSLFLLICVFAFSEMCGHLVTKSWIIDVKNGINGNPGLFGGNASFPNNVFNGQLDLSYQFDLNVCFIPLIALYVLFV